MAAMIGRLHHVILDGPDPHALAGFWSALLGQPVTYRSDDFRVLRGEHVNVSLQRARTPVSARDQMHLDLYTDDQAAEVARLAGLGATRLRHVQEAGDDYVVMTDPEGNEFCVVATAAV